MSRIDARAAERERLSAEIVPPSGGISTQPAPARFPDQCQDASNADFLPGRGFRKRAPVRYDRKILGFNPSADLRLHPIRRDSGERYIVVYGRNPGVGPVLRVFNAAGGEAPVSMSAEAFDYIGRNNASSDQLRLVTAADATLVLNRTVPAESLPTPNYVVAGVWRDYDVMTSNTPADQSFHEAQNPVGEHEAGFFQYDVGGVTFATWRSREFTSSDLAQPWGVYNNAGTYSVRMRFRKFAVAFADGAWTQATKRLVRVGAFIGYELNAGDKINVTAGTGITPQFATIAARISDHEIELDVDIGPNAADVAVDGIATQHDLVYITTGTDTQPDMIGVAARFQDELQNAGAGEGLISWTTTGFQKGYFTVTSPYRGTHATVYAMSSASIGSDLSANPMPGIPVQPGPFANTGATITAGTGSGTLTLEVALRWDAVPPPNDPDGSIDAETMPVRMDRTNATPPGEFTVSLVDWNERISGNSVTNPTPRLWLDKIRIADICFHRERLLLLGGEFLVMSSAGDLFNFYLENAFQIGDDDPISLPLGAEEVTLGEFLTPFRDTVVIFASGTRQYELSAPESLTPITAGTKQTTGYRFISTAQPKVMGPNLFFSGPQADSSDLFSYGPDDLLTATSAERPSAHYESALPERVKTIATATNQGLVLVLPREGNVLHVYRTETLERRKIHAAWTKYEFPGSGYRIVDIAIMDDELWMLIESQSQYTLERMWLTKEPRDDDFLYPIHLDRKMRLPIGVIAGALTVWTLPDGLQDSTINSIVLSDDFGPGLAGTALQPDLVVGGFVGVLGVFTAGEVTVGRQYPMEVEPTRPFQRNERGIADVSNGVIIRRLGISHEDTGRYDIKHTPEGRDERTETFEAFAVSQIETGFWAAYPTGDPERNQTVIFSRSPRPVHITGLRWEFGPATPWR